MIAECCFVVRAVPLSTSSVSAHATSAVLATVAARTTASHPTAVIICVPLMSASPSLAPRVIGAQPRDQPGRGLEGLLGLHLPHGPRQLLAGGHGAWSALNPQMGQR